MINLLRHCQRGKLVLRNFKFTYTPKVNLSTEDNQQRTESSTEKKSSVLSFEEASKITEDKVK